MAKKHRKDKQKENSKSIQMNDNDHLAKQAIFIEIALALLYFCINFIYNERFLEIATNWKAIATDLAPLCTVTGLNLSKVFGILERYSKKRKWLKCLLKYKHIILILLLVIINTWVLSSVFTSKLNYEVNILDNQRENKLSQELDVEDEIEVNVDVFDGEHPDLNPASILATDDSMTIFTPHSINELYVDILEKDLVDKDNYLSGKQLLTRENKDFLKNAINTCFQKKRGTGSQPTNDEINGNVEFTHYTEKANKLSEILAEKGIDESILQEIIELRTRAYEIIPIKNLRLLLANDWERLGLYYYKTNRSIEDTYNSLLKSIEYRIEYLQMISDDDTDFYYAVYRIGRAFSTIAITEGLENNHRLHASLIACCILEMSSSNSNNKDSERTLFYGSYYAGMENHKLLLSIPLLGKDAVKELCGIYINDGLKFYERSIEANNYQKQRYNQHEYINQIANIGINYVKNLRISNCLSISELEDIKKQYP